jgi:16S rRNA (uracil1498-N3)-methyltransferase
LAYRLFSPQTLFYDALLFLGGQQAHYLGNVLRLLPSDSFHIFNGEDGEWRAVLVKKHKKGLEVRLQERVAPPCSQTYELFLFFAPIKFHRLDWLLEKATEMGVTHLVPCRTERTCGSRINLERLERITIEATEQSGRLRPPLFWPLAPLHEHLKQWQRQYAEAPFFLCDLEAKKSLILELNFFDSLPQVALAIGPEGGWSPLEKQLFHESFSESLPVTLGSTILRAETAALLGLGILHLFQEQKHGTLRGQAL